MEIDLSQLDFIDDTLKEIALETEAHFGIKFTVTSLYRMGDMGVHGQLPLRGLDLRCKDHDMGIIVKRRIDSKWIYDPVRPVKSCCIFHDSGSGYHLHLQAHPNTRRRY